MRLISPHVDPDTLLVAGEVLRMEHCPAGGVRYVGATRATQRLIVLANEALRARLTV